MTTARRPRARSPGPSKDDLPESIRQFLERYEINAAFVELHRRRGPNTWDYVTEFPPEDFSYAAVREEFGPGVYQIRVFKEGQSKPLGSTTFGIAHEGHAQPTPAVGVGGSDLATKELAGIVKELMAEVRGGGAAPAAAAAESMKLFFSMSQLMQQQSADMMKVVLELKRPDSGGGFSEGFAIFREGMKMAKEAGKGAGSDDSPSWVGALTELAPQLLEKLEKPAAQLPPGAPNAAEGGGEAARKSLGMSATAAPWAVEMADYVPDILGMAAMGKNPARYGDLILSEVPASYRDGRLRELLNPARGVPFLDDFVLQFPTSGQHRAWLERAVAEMQRQLYPVTEGPAGGEEPQD